MSGTGQFGVSPLSGYRAACVCAPYQGTGQFGVSPPYQGTGQFGASAPYQGTGQFDVCALSGHKAVCCVCPIRAQGSLLCGPPISQRGKCQASTIAPVHEMFQSVSVDPVLGPKDWNGIYKPHLPQQVLQSRYIAQFGKIRITRNWSLFCLCADSSLADM